MESVWSVCKLSTEIESVGSRRELVANVFTLPTPTPTRCNSTAESRQRRQCVLGFTKILYILKIGVTSYFKFEFCNLLLLCYNISLWKPKEHSRTFVCLTFRRSGRSCVSVYLSVIYTGIDFVK